MQLKSCMKDPSDSKNRWVPVEGIKQTLELGKGLDPELVILSVNLNLSVIEPLLKRAGALYLVPDRLMRGLSQVENNQGIIGFFQKPDWGRQDLTEKIICLDGVQDPGNMGAVIRTAAALGGFSVVSCGSSVSFFNGKVIRASAGYLFTVPCLPGVPPSSLQEMGYQVWHTFPGTGTPLPDADLQHPLAVVLGGEGRGLNPHTVQDQARRLTIPMDGDKDSLNVAVAASIIMYEIQRRISRTHG